MKTNSKLKLFMFIFLLFVQSGGMAQKIKTFDGRWAFTGLRTTVFKVVDDKLYVGMLEHGDTSNFNRFLQQLPLDSTVYTAAIVAQKSDTIIIQATFPSIDHDLVLLYVPGDPDNIWYTGDVFFDSAAVIVTNKNCSPEKPACINRLYSQKDLKAILRLKTSVAFTRDDAFEFLLRLNDKLKSRCNRCYAGFTDAYMNEILIDMGFNPIVRLTAVRSVWHNTSGFTFYIKNKFPDDQRLIKLIQYVFESYLK